MYEQRRTAPEIRGRFRAARGLFAEIGRDLRFAASATGAVVGQGIVATVDLE
jgi:hypothetical protein